MSNDKETLDDIITFDSPQQKDILVIANILKQWLDTIEVEKYIERIGQAIKGRTEHGMNFWVIKEDSEVIGIGGLSDPLPNITSFAKTKNPGELKILYLDNKARGKGLGRQFILFLEEKSREQGRTEILVRSAEQYRNTAFEFYKKCGYEDNGSIINNAGKPMQLFTKILLHSYEN